MNTPVRNPFRHTRRVRRAGATVLAVGASLVGATLATSGQASAAQAPATVSTAQVDTQVEAVQSGDKRGGRLARGVDVSGHQHPKGRSVNFGKIRKAGYTYAFVKATEGRGFVNEYVKTDGRASERAGLATGFYHFARPGTPAVPQARHFVNQVRRTGVHKPMLVLDLEANDGRGPVYMRAWTKQWLRTVERMTGTRPILYTGPGFWKGSVADDPAFAKYPLWVAHYGTRRPTVPAPWRGYTIWQHTSTKRVPGIPGRADANVGSRSLAERLAPPKSHLGQSAKAAAAKRAEATTSRSGERPAAGGTSKSPAKDPKVTDARIEEASKGEAHEKAPLPSGLLDALTAHSKSGKKLSGVPGLTR